MDISRDNYEQFFLDHLERKLSAEQEKTLRHFLQFNPDLASELSDFQIMDFSNEEYTFSGKELLKKKLPEQGDTLSSSNFDMFSIAYMEGDLSSEQRLSFEAFIKDNPDFEKQYNVFLLSKLPVHTFSYSRKKKLKKREVRVIQWGMISSLSVAAALALFFILGPGQEELTSPLAYDTEMPQLFEEELAETPVKTPTTTPAKKAPVSTIQMIKNSKSPVPKSNFRKEEGDSQGEEAKKSSKESAPVQKRIAGLNMQRTAIRELTSQDDQLVPLSLRPTTFNRSSLNITQLARYEYDRASKIIEDEDVLIWNLASNGLKELNRITGSDMRLLASKDQKGDISGIQFRSKFLNLTTPILPAQ